MIHDQSDAYCQCAYCASRTEKDGNAGTNSLRFTKKDAKEAGMTKDELYAKSLQDSIRTRAFLSSSKNASKFIPDEQLVSSAKKREAKEAALASQIVPVRRRDRLEELLLLEHKARLREEGRLRAERRALGLPEGNEDEATEKSTPSAEPTPAQTPSSHASSGRQSRLSTPASRCSADRDLQQALVSIKGIVDADATADPNQPLSREQIYQLRQLVHDQGKKNRAQVETCANQPHICNHCLSINVQARHLCPQAGGSVAFAQTGKIINPEEGVKFGTDSKRGLDGTYSVTANDQRLLSTMGRKSGGLSASAKSVRFEPTFNNNISAAEPMEADLQYPGSTYNVYDNRAAGISPAKGTAGAPAAPAAALIDSTKSNSLSHNSLAAAPVTANSSSGGGNYKSSSSMWRTTNQARQADMERFVEFQKTMSANSKRVYESTATRNS